MNYREKIDYSSLSTYLTCHRKFLFQYIMHLRSPYPSIHLIFGSCYHYGLETVYKHLLRDPDSLTVIDASELSRIAFNDLWSIEGAPHWPDNDAIFPKSPGHAANMYHDYWGKYLSLDNEEKTILAVESPFEINLSQFQSGLPNYIGRLDIVFKKDSGSIEIVDHKTTKAEYKTAFTSYEQSYQTDGYLTAGHMYYDKIPSIIYNVAYTTKQPKFNRFIINKRKMQIEQFLQDLTYYSLEILVNLDMLDDDLKSCTSKHDHLKSFRRTSGEPCTSYFTPCEYLDLCKMRNNPLDWMHKPPQGFIQREWDPETHSEDLKLKLEALK